MEEQVQKKKKIVAKRFGTIPYTMMQDFRLNRLDILVYSYLSMMTNSEGIAYPSFRKIQANLSGVERFIVGDDSDSLKVKKTQLYDSLKKLRDFQWITEVEDGKYRVNDLAYSSEFQGRKRKNRATKAEMESRKNVPYNIEETKIVEDEMKNHSNVIKFRKIS